MTSDNVDGSGVGAGVLGLSGRAPARWDLLCGCAKLAPAESGRMQLHGGGLFCHLLQNARVFASEHSGLGACSGIKAHRAIQDLTARDQRTRRDRNTLCLGGGGVRYCKAAPMRGGAEARASATALDGGPVLTGT